jgi:hypothetical protein
MATDPKAEAAKKQAEDLLKKIMGAKPDTSKLDALMKEGNALKNDKEAD